MSATALAPISPTGFPWPLVDRVLEVEPRRRAVGEKLVSANEPYFVGHFPGAPVFPGVVLCEALAQLAGVLAEDDSVRLVGVERARFRRPVLPGEVLRLEVQALAHGPPWRAARALRRARRRETRARPGSAPRSTARWR